MPVKEKEVIAWLSERKLMPSPELVSHISNHPEGLGLLERTVMSLTEPKLFLGISDLVEEERAEVPKPVVEEPKRARNDKGHYIADDPSTPENEAWVGGKAPKKK